MTISGACRRELEAGSLVRLLTEAALGELGHQRCLRCRSRCKTLRAGVCCIPNLRPSERLRGTPGNFMAQRSERPLRGWSAWESTIAYPPIAATR